MSLKQGIVCALLMMALGAGCTGGSKTAADPKARLQEYISLSFAVKSFQEREQLINYLTGQARVRLTAWSESQFKQAFLESKRQFLNLRFDEVKQVSPTEVRITYEITYGDQNRGTKVTNKKIADMVNENGRWLIREVENVKELVEYKNEMSLP